MKIEIISPPPPYRPPLLPPHYSPLHSRGFSLRPMRETIFRTSGMSWKRDGTLVHCSIRFLIMQTESSKPEIRRIVKTKKEKKEI